MEYILINHEDSFTLRFIESNTKKIGNYKIINYVNNYENNKNTTFICEDESSHKKYYVSVFDNDRLLNNYEKIFINFKKNLLHDNIARIYDLFITNHHHSDHNNDICFVYEYTNNMTPLYEYFENKICDEIIVKKIIHQIIITLQFASKFNIYHKKISMANILFDEKNLNIKIINFHLDNIYNTNDNCNNFVPDLNSISYLSQEQIKSNYHNYDNINNNEFLEYLNVWQIGIIIYKLLTGNYPFCNKSVFKIITDISNIKYIIHENLSHDARCLITNIFTNISKRYKFKKILIHNWLYSIQNFYVLNYK